MNQSNRNIWRRLRRNKGAVFGLIIIALAIGVALTAYFIAPDPSPDANRMIVEIGGHRPGFTQEFLCLRRSRGREDVSFFKRLLSGREDAYTYIPDQQLYAQGGQSYRRRIRG